jgi:glycolate oxidase iron-sulfur subunit
VLGKKAADILFGRLPVGSGLKLRLAMFADTEELDTEPTIKLPRNTEIEENALVYFPGCASSYLYPTIVESVCDVLAAYGYKLQIPDGLSCCGLALMSAGDLKGAQRLARNNIQLFEQSDGPIMVSCGSCYAHLSRYPHLFEQDESWKTRAQLVCERLVEISRFIEALQQEEALVVTERQSLLKVFYHDPCHMRHDLKITDEPRTLLRALPGVDLLELADGPQCCGQGGLFHVGAPELSSTIRDDLAGKILAMNPDVITTTCSGCLMQLKTAMAAADSRVPVVHLAALIKQCSQVRESE